MKNILFGLALISFSLMAHSETPGWVTKEGNPVPNSDAMKSINGFGGWLIATPDSDWEEKWNTSPESTPHFSEKKEVTYGEKLTILDFFINPEINSSGTVDILCDVKVTMPNGVPSLNLNGVQCAEGKLQGDPHNVYLSSAVIKYIGEAGDLPGEWIVEIALTDQVRGVTVPLKTHFNLHNTKESRPPPRRS